MDKRCTKCGEIKIENEFHKGKNWCKECRKQDAQAYYQQHKKEYAENAKQYRQAHHKERLEYNKRYRQSHKDKITEYSLRYCKQHKEERAEYNRRFNREHRKEMLDYQKRRYQIHKKERAEFRKVHREELKEWQRQYRKTEKGKITVCRCRNKRARKLGFNPLNKPFNGSVWHHINDIDVIAIPVQIHRKYYTGIDTSKHRELVLKHYGSIRNMIVQLSGSVQS